jgi:hypothetical protein
MQVIYRCIILLRSRLSLQHVENRNLFMAVSKQLEDTWGVGRGV